MLFTYWKLVEENMKKQECFIYKYMNSLNWFDLMIFQAKFI